MARLMNMQYEWIKSNFISTTSVLLVVVDVLALEQCKQILEHVNLGCKTHLKHHIWCFLAYVYLLDLKHGNYITLPCSIELDI